VSPVRHELDFYITEDDILHSHRRGNLKSFPTSCGPTEFIFIFSCSVFRLLVTANVVPNSDD
jgi:hypothetical protein